LAHPVSARLSKKYTASAGRKFGLTVGAALAVLTGIGAWRGHSIAPAILGSVALALIIAGLVVPAKLRLVDDAWMKLAHALSRVTTPIFMGVVYFVVLTPVGFLRRLIGGSALVHRAGASQGTWFDRTASQRSALDRLF